MRFINLKIWQEKRGLTPDRRFKRALKTQLDQAFSEKYPECNLWYQTRVFKYSMVALLAVFFLGSSGVGVYAYSSPEVTEGAVLYPIKKAIENVEARTKRTPEARAKFKLKQIERREAEKSVLEKKPKKQMHLRNLEDRIAKNEEDLEKIDKELVTSTLKEQVQRRLQKKEEKLKEKNEKQQEKKIEIKLKNKN